jgi:hypothetical protein
MSHKANMSSSGTEARLPSTKERLASIVQGFDAFDSEMKTGTRVRIHSKLHGVQGGLNNDLLRPHMNAIGAS